ncbi:MAG: 23S rRNA (adenine(2503)-C(2))-methyltransferase RlmN [Phycisphaerales bacterium]
MIHPANHIFAFTPETLTAWCAERKMPAFRAKQILEWVYHKGIIDPAAMTSLSKLDRDMLAREMAFLSGDVVRHQSASDGTEKLLVAWDDSETPKQHRAESDAAPTGSPSLPLPIAGETAVDDRKTTECVMIPTEDRRTACISSQVGCPVGCKFCASGVGGLESNLSGGRIVEQVWRMRDMMRTTEPKRAEPNELPRITNVVFMGMGEPLSNFAATMHAVKVITSLWGHAISARKVTISTVGLPAAIERLAAECDAPVTLALSLHAPTDDIRRELIPWAEYSTIAQLLSACNKWFQKTGREITLEYTLLRGVNDKPDHAVELARLAKSLRANVNLIRYNEVAGMPFQRPTDEGVRAFQTILRDRGTNSHIRASRGRDIAAACGQLRYEAKNAHA